MSWYTESQTPPSLHAQVEQLQQQAATASNLAIDFTSKVGGEQLTEYYALRKAIDDVRFGLAHLSGVLKARGL